MPLGADLEGPFLGRARRVPVELLRTADLAWLEALFAAHPAMVRMVTLAPEADPGLGAVRWLAARGVLVALGHSDASDGEARGSGRGSGRDPCVQRDGAAAPPCPGLVGAALDDDRLTPTLIADFVHLDPTVARIVLAASGSVVLVSDAVATGGPVQARDGAAWRADGRLAGATTLLDGAVANLVRVGVPVERVVAAASTVPADLLGVADRGRLTVGARADVVALDPAPGPSARGPRRVAGRLTRFPSRVRTRWRTPHVRSPTPVRRLP